MKKIMCLVASFCLAIPAIACDGNCACGGKPKKSFAKNCVNFGINTTVGFIGGMTIGGPYTIALFGVKEVAGPELVDTYKAQRKYNLKHGIKHGRDMRNPERKGVSFSVVG